MSVLTYPRPMTRQPSGGVYVNSGNKFGRRVLQAVVADGQVLRPKGQTNSGEMVVTRSGKATTGGNNSFLRSANVATVLKGRIDGATSAEAVFSALFIAHNVTTTGTQWISDLQETGSGFIYFQFAANKFVANMGLGDQFPALATGWPADGMVFYTRGIYLSTAPKVWMDGVSASGDSAKEDSWRTFQGQRTWFGSEPYPVANRFYGNGVAAIFFRGAFTDNDVAELRANPWQVFADIPRRIWVGAAAVGGASNAPRYFHRTQAGMS